MKDQNRDTEMVPGGDKFPATPWSAIIRAGTFDGPKRREALERLPTLYWRPIYASVDRIRKEYDAENKPLYRKIFERYQLSNEEDMSYESVAKEFGVNVWDVTNYLADARRRLREAVMERVQEYCSTDEEFREEL